MIPLIYLAMAFKGWMFVDALRRKAPMLWFFVLLAPFGSLIYFVAVKLPDFRIRPAALPEEQRAVVDLESLQSAVRQSPSFDNRMALGLGLLHEQQPKEARRAFADALATHPHDNSALLGFAQACLAMGDPASAQQPLQEIVNRRLSYQDFAAAHALVSALRESGDAEGALNVAEQIARNSQRYEHRLELAELQVSLAKSQEAQATLEQLLAELTEDPSISQQRHATLSKQARTLLRSLNK